MFSIQKSWRSMNFLIALLVTQLLFGVFVVLDIQIVRQVIGFLYLTFVPGMILLRILRLDGLDTTENLLLSMGLSIAFLMFIGLLINELGPLIGVSKPLSLIPLMVTLNVVILLLGFLSYLLDKDRKFPFSLGGNIRLTPAALLLVCLPLLSVLGAILASTSGNNFILLLLMVTISLLIVCSVSGKIVPPKLYSLALLTIAVALLFHASLISNYIYGNDVQSECYLFKLTERNSHWNSTVAYANPNYQQMNAMLSITVLPSVYSAILDIEATWILKIIYPLIFSFVSLGLYKLFNIRLGKKIAFLSTFFFIANSTFFAEMLGVARQMVAELFFVLLFFVLYKEKMNRFGRWACFVIFSSALVVSHYALSYIFLFIVALVWLFLFLMKSRSKRITASSLALFFTIAFSWYIYVSASGPFNGLLNVSSYIYDSLSNFFNPASRGSEVLRGLGMEVSPSFWNSTGRIFAYITEFFIVIGFITHFIKPLARRRNMVVDREYIVLLSVNMALLAMCIILPNFASSFEMTRFYHVLLFSLAPLCVLGGEAFFKLLLKTESYALASILIVLIPFFLFQTGFVYEVTGAPSWSIPLSKYRMGATPYVVAKLSKEQDVFGANWLSKNSEAGRIYADGSAIVLFSYGMIPEDRVEMLYNTTTVSANGIVYLRWINVVQGIMWRGEIWNTTEISFILNDTSLIYSNGGSQVYKNP